MANAKELRIVRAMIAHLAKAGFELSAADDGDERKAFTDANEAIEWAFQCGNGSLIFRSPDREYGVFLIEGNGEDVISDHSDDRGPFAAAMDAFDPEAAGDAEAECARLMAQRGAAMNITDETELKSLMVVGDRCYTVPRDVKEAHDRMMVERAELVAALRKADQVITALFPGARHLAVDVGMLNDNCLAISAALAKVQPTEKPAQRIYTFAIEPAHSGPYTMEWQEESEAAARRQVEQRLRMVGGPGDKVGVLLGTREAQ